MRVTGQSKVLRGPGGRGPAGSSPPRRLAPGRRPARQEVLPASPTVPSNSTHRFHSPAAHESGVSGHRPCKHRPHAGAHSRPRCSHAPTCIHDPTQAPVCCTQTTNLQTRLHALTHVVIHPHGLAPPKTTRGRAYCTRASLLTKLTSWDLLNCCQGEEPATAKEDCQHVGGCPPAPCCLVTKPKPGLRNAGQRREKGEKTTHTL